MSEDHIYKAGAYYGYHKVLQAVREELPLRLSWSECQEVIVGVVKRSGNIDTLYEEQAREAAPKLDQFQWALVERLSKTGQWVMLFDKDAPRLKGLYNGPACLLIQFQPEEHSGVPEDLVAALGPPQEDVLH